MGNFYKETETHIESEGRKTEDIVFIGSQDGEWGIASWKKFHELANFRYDAGYGSAEIPVDLIIIFKDGSYMERGEYDGSEWWETKKTPAVPTQFKPIVNLDPHKTEHSWKGTVADYQVPKEDEY